MGRVTSGSRRFPAGRGGESGLPALVLALAVLGGALPALVPTPARAQEKAPATGAVPAPATESPGRIGVYLQSTCPPEIDKCEGPLVVRSIVRGGAAARAGVQAGDTLLKVAGHPTASAAGREAVSSLRTGVPVQLELAGAAGRRTVSVIPEPARPGGFVSVYKPSPSTGGREDEVWVLRVPEELAALQQLQVKLDSMTGEIAPLVFLGRDPEGTLRVQVMQENVKELVSQLERQRREVEMLWRSREKAGLAAESARAEAVAVPEKARVPGVPEVRVDVKMEEGPPGAPATYAYIVESEDLARRLESVRDSSLRDARVRLDSLVRLHREVRVLPGHADDAVVLTGPPQAPDAEPVVVRGVPPAPAVAPLLGESFRAAGAEFRVLTPDLAEYFQGADHGLLVMRVLSGTPAARLGLRGGDVVVSAGGVSLNDVETLRDALARSPRTAIEVEWVRKGSVMKGRLGSD